MAWYCDIAPGKPPHDAYHACVHGFPVSDDRELLERLALEIMQAGLSWDTVLKKRKAFNRLFDRFNSKKVAAYTARDVVRIMRDDEGIRNKLKIESIIHNAGVVVEMKGFASWLDAHHPLPKDEWVRLFRKTFKFMGPEIVGEFLMSTGYLPGAHREDCPIYATIKKLNPPFLIRPLSLRKTLS